MSRVGLIAAILGGLCLSPALAQTPAKPAAACAHPAGSARQAICLNAELSQIDQQIARAYSAAAVMMDARGRKALKTDQDAFVALRDQAHASGDYDLHTQMTMRLEFLKAIREPKGRIAGHWANLGGSIEVKPRKEGGFVVRAESTELTAARWICEFDDTGVMSKGMIIVGASSAAEPAGGPNEGWTLALKIAGDTIHLEMLRPKGSEGKPPFCGANGTLDGAYFQIETQKAG